MKLGIRIWVLIAFIVFSLIAINPKLNVDGVEVTSINGIAKDQGINSGDIIKEVNGARVDSVSEFKNALNNINLEAKKVKLKTD